MNKARHDLETKMFDEREKNRNLQEIVRLKDETISKRAVEIEELDRTVIDLQNQNQSLNIKKDGLDRQFQIAKQQLTEKINNLNEVITMSVLSWQG